MARQDLVRSGCRLRIGNGRMTRVWDHPWLPDSHDPFVHSDQLAQHPDLMVADLINYDQGIWNQELISQIFIPRDAGLILQTPVCVDFKDDWYWTGSPKWRIFLWRAITNILPTITNLVRRRVEIPNVCPACGVLEEDVMHILCNCVYARLGGALAWEFSNICWFSKRSNMWNTLRNMEGRNMAVWNLALPSPIHLCVSFHRTWSAWTKSTAHGSVAPLPSHITALPSPASELLPAMQHEPAASLPHNAVLCSTDAGFYGSQHAPTFGFYVRSPGGVFIAAVNGPLSCPYDRLLAEAMAIREALSWLQDHNYHNIVILTDCAVLVDSFRDVTSYRSYLGIILDSCSRLLNSFSAHSIKFVRRGTNLVAHALAKHVGAIHARSVWRDSLPSFIPSELS
ncbi:PREDICTED: uncharacterized protein LOC109150171 [Ipomoea nil]|uniref:uncharacterized protein LOC109150171 n=1 Tax=Ipomoea nil TaxID=35883 RepID=UPI0009013532|nr:PREDICTED: uncharacterized protein LOC109150171 [Ipomoea nil]